MRNLAVLSLVLVSGAALSVACGDDTNADGGAGSGGTDSGGSGSGATGGSGGGSDGGSGGTTGGSGGTGGTVDVGGQGGMGGEGASCAGEPYDGPLGMGGDGGITDACSASCSVQVTVGCEGNTDAVACEENCVVWAWPGCEDEWAQVVACEAGLLASGFQCTTFGEDTFVSRSDCGNEVCAAEIAAEETCIVENPL